jgi:AcrR family transcriptional regulator
MRAVARRCGATTGLVTHHFADRAELVAAALEHAREIMIRRITDLGSDASPFDVLAATLPTDEHMVRSWRVWLSVRAAALVDPAMAGFHSDMYHEWHDSLVTAGCADLDTEDASAAVDHLMAVIDGLALRAALDTEAWPPRRQLDHLARALSAVDGRSA